ncbi:hypothetical protein MW887_011778 [Aspergillus wentii]|nr:hypothetical protein MW887_011778 [Aspergillus wentii]
MRSGQINAGDSSSRSSSFEKTPRGDQDYALEILDPDDDSGSSQFVTVPRGSADSARHEQEYSSEPLLPTSVPHPQPEHKRADRFSCTIPGIIAWIKGPLPPHKYHITPLLRRWQTAPERLIERRFPSKRFKICLLLASLVLWGIVFISVLHSSVSSQVVPGFGKPVKLSCQSRLWDDSSECGLNGDACRPFDKEAFAFSCPAGCSAAMVLEPYTVGPQEVNYRNLVVGGDSGIYRGDSFICPAALHAGVIADQKGGCGILRRTGEKSKFASVDKNGISSIDYPSNFPLSFTFGGGQSDEQDIQCSQDLRWPLFALAVAVTTMLSLSIASPAAFYASIFFISYFQVALSSDPPENPDYYEVVSTGLGRFLPTAFVGFAIYYFCVRHTLKDLDAHWDKTVLWLGPFWVGALNTDTFDKIPISRLTPHDIQQQPGAIPALIIIVSLLVLIVITQALAFRNEGRLPKMLAIYGTMVGGIVALVLVPNMNLRIHHYILALLFLPGTTMQTRPCLLYQGLLVGLFVNGIARWGYDSILQTPGSLLNGAQLGSALPEIAAPLIPSSQDIIFSFPDIEEAAGISVLVNDVERFRSFTSDDGTVDTFNWTRHKEDDPEYFRFAYIQLNALGGFWYEDFSPPVTWDVNGGWNQTKSG